MHRSLLLIPLATISLALIAAKPSSTTPTTGRGSGKRGGTTTKAVQQFVQK